MDRTCYMEYYFDNPEKENTVKVHFINRRSQRIFRCIRKYQRRLGQNACQRCLSGFRCNRKQHTPGLPGRGSEKICTRPGKELIDVYEQLVSKQHEIIGWKKYNHITNNKIFARVNYGYYMFRDGDGVAFKFDTMKRVADPVHMRTKDEDACWGFSHEVGHVHQLQTYLSWGGLGETSNNICTRYCTQLSDTRTDFPRLLPMLKRVSWKTARPVRSALPEEPEA